MDENFETIAEAFSRTAEKYDAFAEDHPNQSRMGGQGVLAHRAVCASRIAHPRIECWHRHGRVERRLATASTPPISLLEFRATPK